ncbi:MAG TPA: hypothetical protein VFQ76_20665 [Longimicrobiaceae bacterium]|nr:hypothetical protein [Longimicrobiaceae bacterium]
MGKFRVMLVLVLGLAACVRGREDDPPPSFPTSGYEVTDAYRELRGEAFEVRHEQSADTAQEPQAVLMEVGTAGGVATLEVARDGRMSVYTSSGRRRRRIRNAEITALAESFRREAARAANRMDRTMEYPLPAKGRIRFYVVGPDGVRTTEASVEALDNHGPRLAGLYESAGSLVTALDDAEMAS